MTQISEFYIEKAKKDLNENESKKLQSLDDCRKWLMKHPFIKVMDPSFLSKY